MGGSAMITQIQPSSCRATVQSVMIKAEIHGPKSIRAHRRSPRSNQTTMKPRAAGTRNMKLIDMIVNSSNQTALTESRTAAAPPWNITRQNRP